MNELLIVFVLFSFSMTKITLAEHVVCRRRYGTSWSSESRRVWSGSNWRQTAGTASSSWPSTVPPRTTTSGSGPPTSSELPSPQCLPWRGRKKVRRMPRCWPYVRCVRHCWNCWGRCRMLNPQFMSTDARFWVKIGFKFYLLCKISNISTFDPRFFRLILTLTTLFLPYGKNAITNIV